VSPPGYFRGEDGREPALNLFCAQSALPPVPAATKPQIRSTREEFAPANKLDQSRRASTVARTHPVWNELTNGISMRIAFRAKSAQGSRMTLVALKRKTIKTPPGWALEVSAR
jgi:hypothetical protein